MPHDIIDNRTEKLVDQIRRVLPGSEAAKFAVGYFYPSTIPCTGIWGRDSDHGILVRCARLQEHGLTDAGTEG